MSKESYSAFQKRLSDNKKFFEMIEQSSNGIASCFGVADEILEVMAEERYLAEKEEELFLQEEEVRPLTDQEKVERIARQCREVLEDNTNFPSQNYGEIEKLTARYLTRAMVKGGKEIDSDYSKFQKTLLNHNELRPALTMNARNMKASIIATMLNGEINLALGKSRDGVQRKGLWFQKVQSNLYKDGKQPDSPEEIYEEMEKQCIQVFQEEYGLDLKNALNLSSEIRKKASAMKINMPEEVSEIKRANILNDVLKGVQKDIGRREIRNAQNEQERQEAYGRNYLSTDEKIQAITGTRDRNRVKVPKLCELWKVESKKYEYDPEKLRETYEKIRGAIRPIRLSKWRLFTSDYWKQKRILDEMKESYERMQREASVLKNVNSGIAEEQKGPDTPPTREEIEQNKEIIREQTHKLENYFSGQPWEMGVAGNFNLQAPMQMKLYGELDESKLRDVSDERFQKGMESLDLYGKNILDQFVNADSRNEQSKALNYLHALGDFVTSQTAYGNMDRARRDFYLEYRGYREMINMVGNGVAAQKRLLRKTGTEELMSQRERGNNLAEMLAGYAMLDILGYGKQKENRDKNALGMDRASVAMALSAKDGDFYKSLMEKVKESRVYQSLMQRPQGELAQFLTVANGRKFSSAAMGQFKEELRTKVRTVLRKENIKMKEERQALSKTNHDMQPQKAAQI